MEQRRFRAPLVRLEKHNGGATVELDAQELREIQAVATLIALYRTNEMPFHFKRALENGVTRDELIEVITHLAFYSGWPTAATAVSIVRRVFEDAP